MKFTVLVFKPRRKSEWVGMLVRLRRDLANGWATFPAGTEAMVVDSFGGLALVSAPCDHCGVVVSINKVPIPAVEPIERLLPTPEGRRPTIYRDVAVQALRGRTATP